MTLKRRGMTLKGRASLQRQALDPYQPVGDGREAAELGRVGVDPFAMEEVDDRSVLRGLCCNRLVVLQALARIGRRARQIEFFLDLLIAVMAVIERGAA